MFPKLGDPAQNFLFELRAHARQRAQLLVFAKLLQFIDGADLKMFEEQRDTLRPQSLDLQKIERGGRKLQQQFIAAIAAAALVDLRQHRGESFADTRHIGDLRAADSPEYRRCAPDSLQ